MRLLFLALFMVLATHVWAQDAQGVTPEGPAVQEQPNGSADGTRGYEWKSALPVTIVESPQDAEHARDREQKADEHEADDLDAQRRAASAAERSATTAEGQIIPTWIQATVAIVGTAALLITIWFSIRATNAAVLSAKLAKEAIDVARDTAQIELRAWIGHDLVNVSGLGVEGAVDHYIFVMSFKNVGATPASGLIGAFARATEKCFSGPEVDFSDSFPTVMAPSVTFSGAPIAFTPAEIIGMRERPQRIRGAVRYDTVFPAISQRQTDITIEIAYIGKADLAEITRGGISPGSFSFTPNNSVMT